MSLSSTIVVGTTWGRSKRYSGAKGKWHLLTEVRHNTSGRILSGRWDAIPVDGVFARTVCGMNVNEPSFVPQPRLKPGGKWVSEYPIPADTQDWCLPCVESMLRLLASHTI
jgi:hypothetical protein